MPPAAQLSGLCRNRYAKPPRPDPFGGFCANRLPTEDYHDRFLIRIDAAHKKFFLTRIATYRPPSITTNRLRRSDAVGTGVMGYVASAASISSSIAQVRSTTPRA